MMNGGSSSSGGGGGRTSWRSTSVSASGKRIQKELKELDSYPPPLSSAGPIADNLYHWLATFLGPPGYFQFLVFLSCDRLQGVFIAWYSAQVKDSYQFVASVYLLVLPTDIYILTNRDFFFRDTVWRWYIFPRHFVPQWVPFQTSHGMTEHVQTLLNFVILLVNGCLLFFLQSLLCLLHEMLLHLLSSADDYSCAAYTAN